MLSGLASLLLTVSAAEPACATLLECQEAVRLNQIDGHAFIRAAETLGVDPVEATLEAILPPWDDLLGHPFSSGQQDWPDPVIRDIAAILDDPGAPMADTLAALMFIRRIYSHDALVLPILQRLSESREPVVALSALNGLAERGEGEAVLALLARCGEEPAFPFHGWTTYFLPCAPHYRRAIELGLAVEALETITPIFFTLTPETQIRLLQIIAYQNLGEAAPLLIAALDEAHWRRNWRLAFEASLAFTGLPGLEDLRAEEVLEAAAEGHWMPAVREQAALALRALRTGSLEGSGFGWADDQLAELEAFGQPNHIFDTRRGEPNPAPMPRAFYFSFDENLARQVFMPDEERYVTPVPECRVWLWDGLQFDGLEPARPAYRSNFVSVSLSTRLKILGSDIGEWGGALVAHGDAGSSGILHPYLNVIQITITDAGPLVLSGLSHLITVTGALDRIDAGPYGHPTGLTRIATLSARPLAMREIAPGRVAIFGTGWAMVADEDGIEGLATCTGAP